MTKYIVEVQLDNTGIWVGNGRQFDTVEKASTYALDLSMRWTSVREWRVVPLDRPITPEHGEL